MKVLVLDTETFPIRRTRSAPRVVCGQFLYDDGKGPCKPYIIRRDEGLDEELEYFLDHDYLIVGHNLAFDLLVIMQAYPRLIPKILKAAAEYRLRDTIIRDTLHIIATLGSSGLDRAKKSKGYFTLDKMAQRHKFKALDKVGGWRLRYGLLDHLPVTQWPKRARDYALDDVQATYHVYTRQPAVSDDEGLQAAADLCLKLATTRGMRTDAARLRALEGKLRTDMASAAKELTNLGYMAEGEVKVDKVRAAVMSAFGEKGEAPPRTPPSATFPNGQVKFDGETLESIADYHPVLKRLVEYKAMEKNLSTFVLPMWGGVDGPLLSRANVLVATGRTSWAGTKFEDLDGTEHRVGMNLQQLPQLEGIRDCFVPRPGYYYASVDYAALELRTLAQCLLWLTGRSGLAEGFNSDLNWDPHVDFAAELMGISKEEARARKAKKDPEVLEKRKLAKAGNFSYPGGVGARRFIDMAAGYGVSITLNEAYDTKDKYVRTQPEIADYYALADHHAAKGIPIRHFVTGRMKAAGFYTENCNAPFQALGADLAKHALIAVTLACWAEPSSPLYGSRVLVFIHDEIVAEVLKQKSSEAALQIKELMERSEKLHLPHVPPSAEAALMSRWTKSAGPKWEGGRLVPDGD